MRLRQEADSIRNEADAYLFHEHLEENNQAFYFHEFADDAARHGLVFSAEADLGDMLVSKFPPEVAQTLQRVATDIIRMEQYMDFVRNRQFRQTLLVHRGAPIQRNIDGRLLPGMLVTSAARPESERPVLAQGVERDVRHAQRSEADDLRRADQGGARGDGRAVAALLRLRGAVPLSRARLREEIGNARSRTTT
jgi:hypothetical protein